MLHTLRSSTWDKTTLDQWSKKMRDKRQQIREADWIGRDEWGGGKVGKASDRWDIQNQNWKQRKWRDGLTSAWVLDAYFHLLYLAPVIPILNCTWSQFIWRILYTFYLQNHSTRFSWRSLWKCNNMKPQYYRNVKPISWGPWHSGHTEGTAIRHQNWMASSELPRCLQPMLWSTHLVSSHNIHVDPLHTFHTVGTWLRTIFMPFDAF